MNKVKILFGKPSSPKKNVEIDSRSGNKNIIVMM